MKFLVGVIATSVPLVIGPIAVSMSLLRRRVGSGTALIIAAGFVATLVYRPEVLQIEDFGARMFLLFLTSVWFAWCFYETDALGAVAALVVFDGPVGLWANLRMNGDLSVLPFIVALAMLAAIPAFALLSLHHSPRPVGPLARTSPAP